MQPSTSPLCRESLALQRSSKIILCGQPIEVDWPVVTYLDNPRFDARRHDTAPTDPASGNPEQRFRYWLRPGLGERMDRAQLARMIRQFVVHYDGLGSAEQCFHVLQDERGLSAHFLIDNDGTIYQTLDLGLMAYHAKGVNSLSIGAELCNRGRVRPSEEDFYQRHGQCRERRDAVIHGQRFPMWDFTAAQYRAMVALGRALLRLFPNLPAAFPSYGGKLVQTCISDVTRFSGYLGHYHITRNKPDPGCFDFARLCHELSQRARWFFCPSSISRSACPLDVENDVGPDSPGTSAPLPSSSPASVSTQPEAAAYPLVSHRELGPRWSGGIDIALADTTPLYCPLPGTVVASRPAADGPTDPAGFVLLRHTVALGGKQQTFYSLFLHTQVQTPVEGKAPWLRRSNLLERAPSAEGVLYSNQPVEAGEIIGWGPNAARGLGRSGAGSSPRLHVQILAAEELTARLSPGRFELMDRGISGLYCTDADLAAIALRASEDDTALGRSAAPSARRSRQRIALRFRSEFGLSDDYKQLLRSGTEFARLSQNQQQFIYRDIILPTLFWTPELSAQTGLPADFVVWHYHPIAFLLWLAQQMAAASREVIPKEEKAAELSLDDLHIGNDFLAEEDPFLIS